MTDHRTSWWQLHRPSSRRLMQLYCALLYNSNLKGFVDGKIYTGPLKAACVPGLNCYSCPGAVGACPLGALQNAVASSGSRAGTYIFGILMLFGVMLGRTICGWLCPVGMLQELLHKIPTPKIKKNYVTRVLSLLKYVILAVLVAAIPLWYGLKHNLPVPAFCKYICPAGTFEGAGGLLASPENSRFFAMLGVLFTRKYVILLLIALACIFCYRSFCRFICPLGAIYSFFCRVAVIGVRVDEAKCTHCGACVNHCPMDVRHIGDRECIHCAECMKHCPEAAISLKAGSQVLKSCQVTGRGPAPACQTGAGSRQACQAGTGLISTCQTGPGSAPADSAGICTANVSGAEQGKDPASEYGYQPGRREGESGQGKAVRFLTVGAIVLLTAVLLYVNVFNPGADAGAKKPYTDSESAGSVTGASTESETAATEYEYVSETGIEVPENRETEENNISTNADIKTAIKQNKDSDREAETEETITEKEIIETDNSGKDTTVKEISERDESEIRTSENEDSVMDEAGKVSGNGNPVAAEENTASHTKKTGGGIRPQMNGIGKVGFAQQRETAFSGEETESAEATDAGKNDYESADSERNMIERADSESGKTDNTNPENRKIEQADSESGKTESTDPAEYEADSTVHTGYEADSTVHAGYEPGCLLEDFTVDLVGGGEFHLADTRGHVTFINLWATYCVPCVQELPYFSRLQAENPEIRILAVHSSLVTDDVEDWLKNKDWNIHFAVDTEDDRIFKITGGSALLPQTIVLNADGEVVYNQTGSVTYEKLAMLLAQAQ